MVGFKLGVEVSFEFLNGIAFAVLNGIAFADSSLLVIASSDLQDTSASAVRANAVADFKLKGDGSAHNSGETGVSGLDEEPTSPQSKGSINEARRLSDDTIKEMVASSGKKYLLPTEVCFVVSQV